MMHAYKHSSVVVMALFLMSCVTINIYFPAAAAEQAADRIIEDVWGADGKRSDSPASSQPQSMLDADRPVLVRMLDWVVSPALAQADLNVNSAAISAIQNRMRGRHEQLRPHYDSGAVGLTADGLVTVRDASSIPLAQRNAVNALVADENKDRHALYAEIARANGRPDWQSDIQQTFARRWISNAASGWWYQQGGNWQQK